MDADEDGYPAGADCDDTDAAISPGASEICDGIDNDCDGSTDEPDAVGAALWFLDWDNDGHGCPLATLRACDSAPTGYVSNNDDCDDTTDAVFPGATEVCDGRDNNCDGQTDEGVRTTFYRDADGDGFGNSENSIEDCFMPPGYATTATDCDDGVAAKHPGATEVCDGLDNDCNDEIDEGLSATFYRDADGDGYGNPSGTLVACAAPFGYTTDNTDCDDDMSARHPDATEICDGLDNNCNGEIDEGVTTTFYADADGDGYGSLRNRFETCSIPPGYASNSSDCDDDVAAKHPGATEICDGLDNNCNREVDEGVTTTFYADADGDGYGNHTNSFEACSKPPGYATDYTDCDDGVAAKHPGATEICDGLDNNCNDEIDEGLTSSFYRDADGDGYGNDANSIDACAAPPGYVVDGTDCDDGSSGINPTATELCDGIDNDCNGVLDDSGFDSDADLVDNCNDPSVWSYDFPCRAGSNNFAPGFELRKFAWMPCCDDASELGMPIDMTGCVSTCTGPIDCVPGACPEQPAWQSGCSRPGDLYDGAVNGGHGAVIGPDHGQLRVWRLEVDIEVGFAALNAAGLIFDWRDAGTFWLIRWDDPIDSYSRDTVIELIRCVDGYCDATSPVGVAPMTTGGTRRLAVEVRADEIEVEFHDLTALTYPTNGQTVGPGRVGVYSFAAGLGGFDFGNLLITRP